MYSRSRLRAAWRGLLSAGLCFVSATAVAAPIVIDNFATNQSALTLTFPPASTTASSSASGQGIVGTERDLQVALSAGVIAGNTLSAVVSSGFLSYSQDATIAGSMTCQWDGVDGASTLAGSGLNMLDLTVGGTQDAIQVDVAFDDLPLSTMWTLYSGTDASSASFTLPGLIFSSTRYVFPLSAFTTMAGAGASFDKVGAITLQAGSTVTAPDLVLDLVQTTATLSSTMTVALGNDVGSDGNANPGDTLHYTVVISDVADAFAKDATNIDFTLPAGPDATLVGGSVTTTKGTVVTGNGAADTDVAVHLNTLADGTTVKIEFDLLINASVGQSAAQITRQGKVKSATLEFLTNDPGTATADDATSIALMATSDVSATMKAALGQDLNQDGMFNPGDSLIYTVIVKNQGGRAAGGLVFTSNLDANTVLIPGSVATSAGTVKTGNGAEDTTIHIEVDPVAGAGATITISFEVRLPATAPRPDSGVVSASGLISDGEFMVMTDDPDTEAPLDATTTPVFLAAAPSDGGTTDGSGNANGVLSLSGGGFSCEVGRSTPTPSPLFLMLLLAPLAVLLRSRRASREAKELSVLDP